MRSYFYPSFSYQPKKHLHFKFSFIFHSTPLPTFKCPEVPKPHCWGLARWYHLSGTSIAGTLWEVGPPNNPHKLKEQHDRIQPKIVGLFPQSLLCQHVFLTFQITHRKKKVKICTKGFQLSPWKIPEVGILGIRNFHQQTKAPWGLQPLRIYGNPSPVQAVTFTTHPPYLHLAVALKLGFSRE